MDKKDEEMDDGNDYMDSANEQSFSTLIAQLSDHPLQVITESKFLEMKENRNATMIIESCLIVVPYLLSAS